jgi:Domain of unknown function (DUF4177)
MFTRASLVMIMALQLILMNQRSQKLAQAQGRIEYNVVDTGSLNIQDALNEYGKAGWQLITHAYVPERSSGGALSEQLIFIRK